jgi:hypothetical protein
MILKNHTRQDLYLIDEDKTLFCLNIFVQMQEKIVIVESLVLAAFLVK